MPININSSIINSKSTDNTGMGVNALKLDGSTHEQAAPSANYLKFRAGISTNGIYWLNPGGLGAAQFYINFTFDSERAWVMVIANRTGTGGMNNLTYADATAAQINSRGTYDNNLGFNLWVGLDYWPYLGNTINQYVATSIQDLSGSHTKRARWKFSGWTSTYAFHYPRDIVLDVGSPNPGWYEYHALNGYSLTTYDNDQDENGQNCSGLYANNPWWYGSCWDGNYFAGGSYADRPYWDGSGGDNHAYGAAFLAFTDI